MKISDSRSMSGNGFNMVSLFPETEEEARICKVLVDLVRDGGIPHEPVISENALGIIVGWPEVKRKNG